ncbi:hypothetical protein KUCAC02_013949, partial [Chaenocephalus aceratus]
DARQKFRSVLVEATVKLDELVKKIGKPVEESKPYWEARRLARQWVMVTRQKSSQSDRLSSRRLKDARFKVLTPQGQSSAAVSINNNNTLNRDAAKTGEKQRVGLSRKKDKLVAIWWLEQGPAGGPELHSGLPESVGGSSGAKETISLAEQRLLEEDHRQFDSAWQEMLNHATQRVMEAENTKTRSELVHKETAAKYTAAINRMKQLEKKLKRTISKSKPYFEMKAKCYLQLENLKRIVDERQARLSRAKGEYKMALRNLEKISDEIHERRRSSSMGPRGRGVGSEGHSVSGDDGSSFKMESDRISRARAAGAEGDLDNAPPSNTTTTTPPPPPPPPPPPSSSSSSTKRSFSLETRFSFLNLRRPRSENAKNSDKSSKKADQTEASVKGL